MHILSGDLTKNLTDKWSCYSN